MTYCKYLEGTNAFSINSLRISRIPTTDFDNILLPIPPPPTPPSLPHPLSTSSLPLYFSPKDSIFCCPQTDRSRPSIHQSIVDLTGAKIFFKKKKRKRLSSWHPSTVNNCLPGNSCTSIPFESYITLKCVL